LGPVEDQQVASWVRGGMTDAMVRDETGSQWMTIKQSPFRPLLPRDQRSLGGRLVVAFGMAVAGLIAGGIWGGATGATIGGVGAGLLGLLVGNAKIG